MNRNIKFRGKRVDTGEWVYGYYFVDYVLEGSYLTYYKHFIKTTVECLGYGNSIFLENKDYEVIPETVGQYTGLKDKNKKEIYEDDILKSDWGYQGLVELESIFYNNVECTISDDIEIIGNKHENPELLNEEK